MDKFLRPERFDADPHSPDASKQWAHWHRTFVNFLSSIESHQPNKLNTLVNYISPSVYELIADYSSFEEAISALESLYVQPKNEVFARHILSTTKQEDGQNLDQFLQKLNLLAKECNFRAVTADQNREEATRDAFITGIKSSYIRQRLLEHKTLDLRTAFEQAKLLERAHAQSQIYLSPSSSEPCGAVTDCLENASSKLNAAPSTESSTSAATWSSTCFFCGYNRHPRFKCPAKDATCKVCGKKGHYQKVCRLGMSTKRITSAMNPTLSSVTIAAAPNCLSNAVTKVLINGISMQALIDTGSSESYISFSVVHENNWPVELSRNQITMASTKLSSVTLGHCYVTLRYKNTEYHRVKLSLLQDLCSDVLLGHDFLRQHKRLEIPFDGDKPPFSLCGLSAARVKPPSLFEHLSPECKPIATKSRRHSPSDEVFIECEIQRLLKDNIIEPSKSPWRAQVLVTTNEKHKRRMVIDYSQTINRYTYLDAYPLPRIDNLIQKIAEYEVYSTLDLQSAYHQIPLREEDKKYTAFEACGNLYQFRRIPFGVTNGVACFQRTIDNIIKTEQLKDTFAYIDNVTICGKNLTEHDLNLNKFMKAAEMYGITFNDSKSIIAAHKINLLGYEVSHGIIKPDPERFKSLREYAPPHNIKAQQRVIGLFAYYSQWISHFSDKIHLLVQNKTFPLPTEIKQAFESLKKELESAAVTTVDREIPLVVETDASDIAIAATLSQNGRPVAFFSRTLSPSEKRHSAVEKEAYAIVEAVKKWRHYLLGNHFKLVTDQRSVAFMYDCKQTSKIKNDKILRWRMELSCFQYDVVYRPGSNNHAADAFSRRYCASIACQSNLKELHCSLGHPGITRMMHFVRLKNLPYSSQDVKLMTNQCRTCAEIKPRFFKPPYATLIKATQPWERLSIDFKGPLPSVSQNKYLLTVIDEYSRFPFAFACQDMSSSTVINCLCQLFAIFGMPSYIHSDRGASFMSEELKNFLHLKGIATSRTTSYSPQANGQVERLNSTLWKSITLMLKDKGLEINRWECVLLDALHSIRSLLCTATNATPHERMFSYCRKSTSGTSLPSWLSEPGPVLLRKHNRNSKYDPLVEEVELVECNPQYARVRLQSGREETVSIRHLAPLGHTEVEKEHSAEASHNLVHVEPVVSNDNSEKSSETTGFPELQSATSPNPEDKENLSRSTVVELSNDQIQNNSLENLIEQQQRTRPYSLRSREI